MREPVKSAWGSAGWLPCCPGMGSPVPSPMGSGPAALGPRGAGGCGPVPAPGSEAGLGRRPLHLPGHRPLGTARQALSTVSSSCAAAPPGPWALLGPMSPGPGSTGALPPLAHAAARRDAPGLPSRSLWHAGCCGLLLDLLPVRSSIGFLSTEQAPELVSVDPA